MKKYLALILSLVMVAMFAFTPVEADVLESTTAMPVTAEPMRVRAEETAMNTAVYDNGDGTYTMDVYGMDIKYIDSMGNVSDKSNRLILDKNNNYYNPDNDITARFPQNLFTGISLQCEDYNISLIPVAIRASAERLAIQRSNEGIALNSSGSNAKAEISSVEYQNVFSDAINIRYTPMFNGIKEEIILEKYEGINEFQFVLKTNGLEVSDSGGIMYLINPDKQLVVGHISDIVIFDSRSKHISGALTITENIKAEEYGLKITVPVEYLTASDTVYPVIIDPSFTVTVSSGTNKEIQDSPVYSGLTSLQPGISVYNNVGRMPSTNYGYSRSLIKFPGVMENIENLALTADRITSVTYKAYCVEAASNISVHMYKYPGSTWDENTVSYSSSGMSSVSLNSSNLLDSVTVSGSSSTAFPLYSFDITDYILECLSGTSNPDKGVVLKNGNETSSVQLVRFASTEYSDSSYWPSVSVTYMSLTSNDFCFYVYDAETGSPIPGATVYAYRPKTNVNQAYSVPTGYTTNMYGAVVFDKTELPYPDVYAGGYGINVVASGYAQYTSPNADKYSGNTIHSVSMYSVDNYPNYNSPFATGVECTTPSMEENQHWGWRYLVDVDYHTGVDVAHAKGTPLYSVTNSGTVMVSSVTAGAGHYVIIKSGNYYTAYLHMNTRLVSAGSTFSSRTQVGTVGKTGGGTDGLTESYAAHLHISVGTKNEISKAGRNYLDPLAFIPFE